MCLLTGVYTRYKAFLTKDKAILRRLMKVFITFDFLNIFIIAF